MVKTLEYLINSASEMGAARLATTLGLSAGELSYRKARNTYGKWFTDAVAERRLMPCRIEEGKNGTRFYSVLDITKLKTLEASKAILKIKY